MSDALTARIDGLLWHPRLARLRGPPRLAITALRFLYAVLRDVVSGDLTLRAMGLVYITILSVVPAIAISFSVLKAFGFHRQMEPLLYNLMLPLGEKGAELTAQVIGFVDNVQGNVLAGIGLALLFFTTLSMAEKVEDSFNHVWHVGRARSIGKRLSEYLVVLLVGPVVMVTAMTLLATLQSTSLVRAVSAYQPVAWLLGTAGQLAPYLLVCGAFTFVYWFVPNTRVLLRAAAVGGLVGGVLWATTGALFAAFVVSSTRTLTIYATFAIVIIALIWLHLCWLILLIGAQVAFYVQNPAYLRLGYGTLSLGSRQREQIALFVMLLVGTAFRTGRPLSEAGLAGATRLPVMALNPVLERLEESALLARTAGGALLPQREPGQIPLREIITAIREPARVRDLPAAIDWPAPVSAVSLRMQTALESSLGGETLADFLEQGTAPEPVQPDSPG